MFTKKSKPQKSEVLKADIAKFRLISKQNKSPILPEPIKANTVLKTTQIRQPISHSAGSTLGY